MPNKDLQKIRHASFSIGFSNHGTIASDSSLRRSSGCLFSISQLDTGRLQNVRCLQPNKKWPICFRYEKVESKTSGASAVILEDFSGDGTAGKPWEVPTSSRATLRCQWSIHHPDVPQTYTLNLWKYPRLVFGPCFCRHGCEVLR